MCDQYSILPGCEFQEIRIPESPQTGGFDVEDVDRRLAIPQAANDAGIQVFIRQ
jgi:hypothetical protein